MPEVNNPSNIKRTWEQTLNTKTKAHIFLYFISLNKTGL